jgi:methylthioribulose-1-phosphate dehydratase
MSYQTRQPVDVSSGKGVDIVGMEQLRRSLISVVGRIAERGWARATAGNFSVLLEREPLRMLMSPSGVDKSLLAERDLIEVSGTGEAITEGGKASAETLLHTVIYEQRPANCVLHVHTVWNTILSKKYQTQGSLTIAGYEILKALSGVKTHEHSERIPVYDNTQDIAALSRLVKDELTRDTNVKSFLIAGHGVYTWGDSSETALRHLEALEFLFETLVRTEQPNL